MRYFNLGYIMLYDLSVLALTMSYECSQYNAKDSSVKLLYEAQPRPRAIAAIAAKNITKVACGHNHTGLFLS